MKMYASRAHLSIMCTVTCYGVCVCVLKVKRSAQLDSQGENVSECHSLRP